MKTRLISPLEVAIIHRLVDAAMLPPNLTEAQVVEIDQWGSIEFLDANGNPHKHSYALPQSGAVADVDGVPILITLYVSETDDISELEIYKLDDSPLCAPIDPKRIILQSPGPGPIIV